MFPQFYFEIIFNINSQFVYCAKIQKLYVLYVLSKVAIFRLHILGVRRQKGGQKSWELNLGLG